ncbi:hypothetical protein SEA_HEATHEN_84 [Mycobacterium phage Heathen]|uniref:Uncharacterized protein n=3 Tax=Veracruzvirus TaxID=2948946 RepID=A0A8F3E1U2_9CAUD|nr:hypothetical protein KIP29_gp16 [Mycobacterium phage BabyRay]AOT25448.1 hypothetical protein SEA_BABYRAY_84 [Mycobacterium phage BabyRay]QDP44369.1 hypothetical protein SEA_HEATHEN_84 [Mycobacterium phage Heathen]QWY79625.1 hypothetical protein SEA_SCOUT_84 [Mycobacterium phage Scout]
MTPHREERGMAGRAAPEQLRSRLELRRSSAAQPHRNRKREFKRPGKGNRNNWKREG